MKIEILSPFKHAGQDYAKSETRIVEDLLGNYFCRAGWVRDLSGDITTATPNKNDIILMINKTERNNRVETSNG